MIRLRFFEAAIAVAGRLVPLGYTVSERIDWNDEIEMRCRTCKEVFHANPLIWAGDRPDCACVRVRKAEAAWRDHYGILAEAFGG